MLSIDVQFMLGEEKLQFLTWCPSALTPWQIWWSLNACVFGTHILSFHEWRVGIAT